MRSKREGGDAVLRLGVDIGGTKVCVGLLDGENSAVLKITEKTPVGLPWRELLRWLGELIGKVCSERGIPMGEIRSCGMGIPGTVSPDGRTAVKVPNLGWSGAGIAEEFERLTGIPTRLIQDSRAAAYGEYRLGGGRGMNTVVCFTLGTGLGTGIVMNGELFSGALGAAGELGHTPVVPDGRLCGCGKRGCLECYAAGKGLAISAREAFGEESGTEDLFERAAQGDSRAASILEEAIGLLGSAMVALVNLLSPDCLLISGGLSAQRELLIDPLTEYIEAHCYCASDHKKPQIGVAELGEDSPLYGAALAAEGIRPGKQRLSASVMCADMLHMAEDFMQLAEAGIDYLHWDVMDGHFVPNLMLPMEMLNKARKGTSLPYDIHLMAENPERLIPLMDIRSGDIVSVHWESTPHVQRALGLVRAAGAYAALALNPSTPIECVRELLDDIQFVLLMTVNPGFAGQRLIAQSLDKVRRMRRYLDALGRSDIAIEVDGNCSFDNVPKLLDAGAELFVVGSSSVFDPSLGIREGTRRLLSAIK